MHAWLLLVSDALTVEIRVDAPISVL